MIKVTVELVSAVATPRILFLDGDEICNDGTGDKDTGNYKVTLSKFGGSGIWKRGEVKNFDRMNRGAWDLLYVILHKLIGGRKNENTTFADSSSTEQS